MERKRGIGERGDNERDMEREKDTWEREKETARKRKKFTKLST